MEFIYDIEAIELGLCKTLLSSDSCILCGDGFMIRKDDWLLLSYPVAQTHSQTGYHIVAQTLSHSVSPYIHLHSLVQIHSP